MAKRKRIAVRAVTVRLPLPIYVKFEQFAFHRIWSDGRAGEFLISEGLKLHSVSRKGKK